MDGNTHGLGRTLSGDRVRLVPLGSEHTDLVVAWRNDAQNARWFLEGAQFTRDGHIAWLAKRVGSETDFNWIIEDSEGPVGAIGLYDVDWTDRRAEIGRLVLGEPSARGKGYALEAVHLLAEAAQRAGLTMLFLKVKSDNESAIRLYLRTGFQTVSGRDGVDRMELALRKPGEAG
jgi:RimJ/RimL family protein N-acetyltransferase